MQVIRIIARVSCKVHKVSNYSDSPLSLLFSCSLEYFTVVLTRQLIVGTLVPPLVSPATWPPVPLIVNPSTSNCRCVPSASCPNPLPTPPNDGSGQLDIRIVNNGGLVSGNLHSSTPSRFYANSILSPRRQLQRPRLPAATVLWPAARPEAINVDYAFRRLQVRL